MSVHQSDYTQTHVCVCVYTYNIFNTYICAKICMCEQKELFPDVYYWQ